MTVRTGFIHGTGAALNIELGFIPDYVEVTVLTGTIRQYCGWLGKVIVFDSGGLATADADGLKAIKVGDWLKGITSGAKCRIREIILDSGTWAGGDAEGWLICNAEDITGTIQSENAQRYLSEPTANDTATANDIGIVVDVEYGVDIDTEIAAVTGAAGFLSYVGDASNNYAKGFTIGSTISVNNVLMGYRAERNDPGQGQGPRVLGNLQSEAIW